MDIAQPNRPGTFPRNRMTAAAFGLLVAWFVAAFPGLAAKAAAREAQPAVLILDQSAGLPAYQDVIANIRSTIVAEAKSPAAFYTESLDLSRFASPDHSRILDAYLQGKFRNVRIERDRRARRPSTRFCDCPPTNQWVVQPSRGVCPGAGTGAQTTGTRAQRHRPDHRHVAGEHGRCRKSAGPRPQARGAGRRPARTARPSGFRSQRNCPPSDRGWRSWT